MTSVVTTDEQKGTGAISDAQADAPHMERPSKHSTLPPFLPEHQTNPHDGKKQATKPTGEIGGSPIFWLACWFAVNIVVTIQNKSFFVFKPAFTFPVSLSAIHMFFSAVLAFGVVKYYGFPQKSLSSRQHFQVFLFSLLFCANIVVGNLCLRYVSVSLVQVIRSTIPGITIALSIIILGKRYGMNHFASVLLVVTGVGMATYGEIETATITLAGFLLTLLVCFLSSLKSVMSVKFLVGSLSFHPLDLLSRMAAMSCVQMLLLGFFNGEHAAIVEWWQELKSSSPDTYQNILYVLAINGFLAFLLNFANFVTTKKTSPLTVTVSGNVKHVITIILSIIIFQNPVSLFNAVGTAITVIGAAAYSWVEYAEKRKPAAPLLPVVDSSRPISAGGVM